MAGKDKCPVCGKKMTARNGQLMCMDCGYVKGSASVSPNTAYDTHNVYDTHNTYDTHQTNTSSKAGPMFDYNTDHAPGRNSGRDLSKTANRVKIVTSIIGAVVAIISVIIVLWQINKDESDTDKNDSYNRGGNKIESVDTDGSKRQFPKSEYFRTLAKYIFNEDYNKISEEDYERITGIHMYSSSEIGYSLDGGQEIKLYSDKAMNYSTSDLKCFSGLQWIDIEANVNLRKGDLDGLNSLSYICCHDSPLSLTEIVPNKKGLEYLKIYSSIFVTSLDGIEEFSNLKYLILEGSYISDIDALGSLSVLEELFIEKGSNIGDFGVLSELTNLKTLSVNASGLKNISFINNMKQLEILSVQGTDIVDISMLAELKGSLRELYLADNYNIKDYSVIEELTNLTLLTLGCYYDDVLPSLEGLTSLESLYLSGADDISLVKDAKRVTRLTLENCSLENLAVLKELPKLTSLAINEAHSYTKNLHALTELTELEYLDISKTKIFGYIDELLSLPKLKTFIMDECTVAFDFNRLSPNPALEALSMNKAVLIDYGEDYDEKHYYANGEGTKIKISDYSEAFLNFPNLKELYLSGDELTDIEFAAGLEKLEYLDISDNYIYSLTPLLELKNLKTVWCSGNTITEGKELGKRINLITD